MAIRRDTGVGPFSALTVQVTGDAAVTDAVGEPFAYVLLKKGLPDKHAAKARATRIAEALNRSEGHETEAVKKLIAAKEELDRIYNRYGWNVINGPANLIDQALTLIWKGQAHA